MQLINNIMISFLLFCFVVQYLRGLDTLLIIKLIKKSETKSITYINGFRLKDRVQRS